MKVTGEERGGDLTEQSTWQSKLPTWSLLQFNSCSTNTYSVLPLCQHCPGHGDTAVRHTEKACPRGADIFEGKRRQCRGGASGGGLHQQGQERPAEEDQREVKERGGGGGSLGMRIPYEHSKLRE